MFAVEFGRRLQALKENGVSFAKLSLHRNPLPSRKHCSTNLVCEFFASIWQSLRDAFDAHSVVRLVATITLAGNARQVIILGRLDPITLAGKCFWRSREVTLMLTVQAD